MLKIPPTYITPNLGCDPEFFFKRDGEVIGAEKVIQKNGLTAGGGRVIIDGVQAELNPHPSTCRESLASNIRDCFITLNHSLKNAGGKVTADFSRTIEITEKNLLELDPKYQKFGCAPSRSIYEKITGVKLSSINPLEYRTRAAGGHLHFGHNDNAELKRALTNDAKRTVQLLDLICGNTCVLIDRNEGNIERRKVYGKAGEHRLPKHGLEYRTLSNFWLTSFPLMSLAVGLGRLAIVVMADKQHSEKFFHDFTSRVDQDAVSAAINNNDAELALMNFKAIEPILCAVTYQGYGNYPLHENTMAQFYHFVEMIQLNGLEYWFKQDPMTHWTTLAMGEWGGGFNGFLLRTVNTDMLRVQKERNAIQNKVKVA